MSLIYGVLSGSPMAGQGGAVDRTERFYRIDQLLAARRLVSRAELLEDLGVSLATLK